MLPGLSRRVLGQYPRARAVAAALGVALASALTAGCTLEPVPLNDLRCPCADGWTCDTATDRCVRGDEGQCGRGAGEPGAVVLTNFRGAWWTANQARMAWDVENPEALFEYEVDVASSEEALLAGDLVATVTSADNPELARGFLPNTTGLDEVIQTSIRDLDAGTAYRMRLVARDTAGRVSCSNVGAVTTSLEPTETLSMANETEDGGYPNPDCMSLTNDPDNAATGDHYWSWEARCEVAGSDSLAVCTEPSTPAPSCWENLRVEGLDYPMTLSAGEFQDAYLEMRVDVEGSDTGFWAEFGISTPAADPADGVDFWTVGRMTIAAGVGYRLYQLPLRALSSPTGAGPLDVSGVNRGIRSFRVGTGWSNGAVVRIDDAAIRW